MPMKPETRKLYYARADVKQHAIEYRKKRRKSISEVREKENAFGRVYYKKNKERISKRNKMRAFNNPTLIREKHYIKKYGITLGEYNVLDESQNGLCAICRNPQNNKKNLSVDHNHKTGKVRGLLCHKCNVGLGMANDNVEVLESMISYLKNHQ